MERVLSWLPGVKHFEGTVSIDACRRFAASGGRETGRDKRDTAVSKACKAITPLPRGERGELR